MEMQCAEDRTMFEASKCYLKFLFTGLFRLRPVKATVYRMGNVSLNQLPPPCREVGWFVCLFFNFGLSRSAACS
jgi:hypothetical protein